MQETLHQSTIILPFVTSENSNYDLGQQFTSTSVTRTFSYCTFTDFAVGRLCFKPDLGLQLAYNCHGL